MLLYNIACIKSMALAKEQALDCLERSVRAVCSCTTADGVAIPTFPSSTFRSLALPLYFTTPSML